MIDLQKQKQKQKQLSLLLAVAPLALMLVASRVSSFAPSSIVRRTIIRPSSCSTYTYTYCVQDVTGAAGGRPSTSSSLTSVGMLFGLSSSSDKPPSYRQAPDQINNNDGQQAPPSWLVDAFTNSKPPSFFFDDDDGGGTNTKKNDIRSEEETLLKDLEDDLGALSRLRPPHPCADRSILSEDACAAASALDAAAGSTYAMIWNKDMWTGHSDPPHKRYPRHVWQWVKSRTARKIVPAVAAAGTWAAFVSVVAKKSTAGGLAGNVLNNFSGTKYAFSFLSAPLALLLTLRANASMARLLEARLLWGRLVLHARGLSSILRTYLFPNDPGASVMAVRHLASIGWLLKAQVRGEDEQSQLDVLRVMLGSGGTANANYQWMKSRSSKRTVALTTRIRQICASALLPQSSNYSPATHLLVEERICELETVVGACERLFGSPIPPTYTHHSSRVMTLWALLMPMSLLSSGMSTAGVTFATTVAALVFIGLDEVGTEIENVFQLMPLQQLAGATQNDARDQFIDVSRQLP